MKRGLRRLALAIAGLAVLAILFHNLLLAALGSFLVRAQPPEKAEIAVVLGGDYYGKRLLTAAELARQGYVPKILVSGPAGFYGLHECDVAIPFAENLGYPESYFIHFENESHSTTEEAVAAAAELRRMGVHKALVVTSDYHTRRAGNAYRAAAPEIQFVTIAAPDENFTASGWWHSREGRKTALMEWMKTVAAWFKI